MAKYLIAAVLGLALGSVTSLSCSSNGISPVTMPDPVAESAASRDDSQSSPDTSQQSSDNELGDTAYVPTNAEFDLVFDFFQGAEPRKESP